MNFLLAVTCRKGEKLFNTPAIISFLPKRLSLSNPGGSGRTCRSQGLVVNVLSRRELSQDPGNIGSSHWYLKKFFSSVLAGNS